MSYSIHNAKQSSLHLEMSLWVPLLSVNEGGEEDRITNKEDRSVVANKIPIAFLCVELYGKASRIPVVIMQRREL